MACATTLNLCTSCETFDNQQKPKTGILLCTGCQKYFCSSHMTQHRQHLNDLLHNEVVCERNALQEKISLSYEERWSATIRVQIEAINNWEENAIEQIKRSAVSAREQLNEIALKEYECLQKKFSILSNELNTLRENENYLENDIDQLKNKFQQFKTELEEYPVEVSFNGLPNEFISMKSIIQTQAFVLPSYDFIDRLLVSKKPKISIDVSGKHLGQMHPINDQRVTFSSKNQFPTLNLGDLSWQSLHPIGDTIELHWCNQLQLFLVLKIGNHHTEPNRLFHYDPTSGMHEALFVNSSNWDNRRVEDMTTLTCFQEYIVIIRGKNIERWLVYDKQWHTDQYNGLYTCWLPPISCHLDSEIKSIRMNSQYYALIIHNFNQSRYLELRNRGMFTLHRIVINDNDFAKDMRFFSLSDESGWLFFSSENQKTCCYVFDNNGKRHNQNIVLTSNVIDIAVRNDSILVRKIVDNSGDEVIEAYDC